MLEMEINTNDDNLDVNIESQNETLESNIEVNTTLGTDNYKELKNKPSINGVELVDNKTSEELGLQPKGDYATKEYVEQEIATFDFIKIVTELPETGLVNRTYFVPKTNTETNDLYDEYMWVDGKWELVGTKQIEVDLSDYIKNTDLATKDNNGLVRINSIYGIQMLTSENNKGVLSIVGANDNDIKTAGASTKVITPYGQHKSVFYGLAKASGDTTQSASSNAVGTYTDEAKSSIKSMLGIDLTNVVRDTDYVHTDNNYTKEDKDKLSSLSNDYNEIENKPRKLYKPPSRRVNIADIEDGAYDVASEFILKLSTNVNVSAGSILIKDGESCSIQTLIGGYYFTYDGDKWYGGYYATSDDIEGMVFAQTTMSKLSFNSITDVSKVSAGIYINSSNDTSININVLGEERIITGIYINSILIVDFNHNLIILGTRNIIFKYDNTNNYYNEPIDLDELNNRLTNIEDRLTAGGL